MNELTKELLILICSILSFLLGKYLKKKRSRIKPILATDDRGLDFDNVIYRALICPNCNRISAPFISDEPSVKQLVICPHCRTEHLVKANKDTYKFYIVRNYKSNPFMKAFRKIT